MLDQTVKEKLIEIFKNQCEDVYKIESIVNRPAFVDLINADLNELFQEKRLDLKKCGYLCFDLRYSRNIDNYFGLHRYEWLWFEYKQKSFEITPVFPLYCFDKERMKFSFKNPKKRRRKLLAKFLNEKYGTIKRYIYEENAITSLYDMDGDCLIIDTPKFIIRYNELYSELNEEEYNSLCQFYSECVKNRDIKVLTSDI